jgi:hypothetical protein
MDKIEDLKNTISSLNNIYQKWLKLFPFDMEIFAQLKPQLELELPIVKNNEVVLNQETNEIIVDLYSNKTFHQFLTRKTALILESINTLKLVEEGKFDQLAKHEFDITISERRFKLQSQIMKSFEESPDYLSFIQEWFKDEVKFIEKIKSISPGLKQKTDNTQLSVRDWAVIFYYAECANYFEKFESRPKAINHFLKENDIDTSQKFFTNKYYEIQKAINKTNNHPYKQIEKILPYLKKYERANQLAENDIHHLKNEAR